MPFFSRWKREFFRKIAGQAPGGARRPLPAQRMDWLVAGLGNPGRTYEGTRHNAGFLVADHLGARWGASMDCKGFDTLYGVGELGGVCVGLAKPQSFMNLSGPAVFRLADHFGIDRDRLIVVHDDLDLPFGKIKIKRKGGHGGHKGIESLVQSFGSGDFLRIRVGIGRPPAGEQIIQYVLGRFGAQEKKVLGELLELAGDAVETLLLRGIQEGMNRFNNQQINGLKASAAAPGASSCPKQTAGG